MSLFLLPLGRDASAFGARRVRICAERRSHLGETQLGTGRDAVVHGARYD